MKFQVLVLLALSGLNAASPVEQVVNLLSTMKTQITNDGKAEQQIYDKYACWCEKTSTRKASHIVTGGEDMRSLGQRILKLKGKVATLSAEIAELSSKIKANEAEQEELTAVRQKENAAWAGESAETKQALAALQQAITVLAGATTPGKAASALLQQTARLASQGAVKSVLEKLPSASRVPDATMALLSEFTAGKGKAGYAPQSATIQGMLADMYLTFSDDLQSSTTDEANRNSNFEELYASLEKENNQLKDTRDKKNAEKADAEAMLADTTKAYDDTEKQMKADTEFFDQTKAACESKHEEWTERDNMRKEELDGISKAIEILTSDDARALFAKSIKPGVETFLQIASTPSLLQDAATMTVAKAYAALRAPVRQAHSLRLAALAVQVRTAKAGHFDKVIKAIDNMLTTLADEGAADLAKKTQCLDEYQKINRETGKLTWKIKNNEAKIDKLQKLIELRTSEKAETNQRIKETKQYKSDLTAERKEENEAFLQTKKDDEGAIDLLEKAKAAMAKFYKEQGIDMGEIQGSATGLLQGDPAFERSVDDAPDASLSNKGGRKNQSKNILSLLSYIIEDLNDEVANGKKAEAQSQSEFEEEMATANALQKDLEAKVVTLDDILSKRNTDKVAENKDKKANNGDKDAEAAYKEKITPDCDWIIGAFDKRADARSAEAGGLTSAKELLAGQSSLLEKSAVKKFNEINFLGMH